MKEPKIGWLGLEEIVQEVMSCSRLLRENKAFIMRSITFADFKRVIGEVFGSGAAVILYQVGMGCGQRSCKRLMEKYPRRDRLLKALARYKRNEHWGKIDFQLNIEEGTGTITIHNCFEAREYKSTESTCHFMKGYLEGFLTQTYNKPLTIRETACKAKGDPHCKFQVEKKTAA